MKGVVPTFVRDAMKPEDFLNLILAIWGVVSIAVVVVAGLQAARSQIKFKDADHDPPIDHPRAGRSE